MRIAEFMILEPTVIEFEVAVSNPPEEDFFTCHRNVIFQLVHDKKTVTAPVKMADGGYEDEEVILVENIKGLPFITRSNIVSCIKTKFEIEDTGLLRVECSGDIKSLSIKINPNMTEDSDVDDK